MTRPCATACGRILPPGCSNRRVLCDECRDARLAARRARRQGEDRRRRAQGPELETVSCLKCDEQFGSPDKRAVRLCPRCADVNRYVSQTHHHLHVSI